MEVTLAWKRDFEFGEAAMDAAHREFVEIVSAMLSASDSDLPFTLARFREHAERHFGDEDALMGSGDYQSAQCHLDEHKAVLASVAEVQALVAKGNIDVARRLARELARWFPEHTVAMDTGLAAWAQKRRLGGHKIHIAPRPTQAHAIQRGKSGP
jgi:hemerythrin